MKQPEQCKKGEGLENKSAIDLHKVEYNRSRHLIQTNQTRRPPFCTVVQWTDGWFCTVVQWVDGWFCTEMQWIDGWADTSYKPTKPVEMWRPTLLRASESVGVSKCGAVGNRLHVKCRDHHNYLICNSFTSCTSAGKRQSFCFRLKRAISDGRISGESLVIVNRQKKSRGLGLFRFQSFADDESRLPVGSHSTSDSDGDGGVEDSKKSAGETEKAANGQCVDGRQDVDVQIEKTGNNSRKIVVNIFIEGPLEIVWAILTDYEHLADFFPGLAVSKLLEKKHNRVRLYQVGEQPLAIGIKFKAVAVLDCEEKPAEIYENVTRRDIDFGMVEGDCQVFRGTWRMEQQVSGSSTSGENATGRGGKSTTTLSYILSVQPKLWLPVGLIEGILTIEITTNLTCIRDRSLQPHRAIS